MPIKLGSGGIAAVYLGSTPIKAVYHGATKVFSSFNPPVVPAYAGGFVAGHNAATERHGYASASFAGGASGTLNSETTNPPLTLVVFLVFDDGSAPFAPEIWFSGDHVATLESQSAFHFYNETQQFYSMNGSLNWLYDTTYAVTKVDPPLPDGDTPMNFGDTVHFWFE